jgi:hypothetical protein
LNLTRQAKGIVQEAKRNVANQRKLLVSLEADEHTERAAEAQRLLGQFEELQALHIADRDRLRKELGL